MIRSDTPAPTQKLGFKGERWALFLPPSRADLRWLSCRAVRRPHRPIRSYGVEGAAWRGPLPEFLDLAALLAGPPAILRHLQGLYRYRSAKSLRRLWRSWCQDQSGENPRDVT